MSNRDETQAQAHRPVTLIDFLLARIAEDEWAAEAFVNDLGEARRWRADAVGGIVRRVGTPPFGLSDIEATTAGHMESEHIARHDPARVLADCKGKLHIIGQHRWSMDVDWSNCGLRERTAWKSARSTMVALALPYADHPDYRLEWSL